ncbi:MAG TPA: tetratricopeptide repeat protein [Verrucomicrobiae bacterium]|jgi:tetratricopeptide (TPR) repeat protein|nr:tetratricopeptide repeat protein [Verrucomicrobiae bacterium]
MPAKKNRNYCGAIIFLTLALFIAGCTPPGPRALLKGKKLLERGDYTAAVEQFKTATTLLPANAQAWNYLGVACQRAGQPADAVTAYQRALKLDRDLVEAHYNLGVLWLEQQKFDSAKTELTAYTLRRGNAPEGWLKLGLAELRSGDLAGADKSYGNALYLNTNNAEALNGRGLVRVERGHPRDAALFFAAAVQFHPDYAPAILNLAAVAQQDLHDNKLALEYYRVYLALTPRAEKWDEVNAIVANLETPVTVAVATPPPRQNAIAASTPPIVHPIAPPKTQTTMPRAVSSPLARVAPFAPPQVVKVTPEPVIVPTPVQVVVAPEPVVVTSPPEPPSKKPGILTRLNPIRWISPSAQETKYVDSGVTPLPSSDSPSPTMPMPVQIVPKSAPPAVMMPIHIVQPAAPTFPRYLYLSPRKPGAGNRVAAAAEFSQAQIFEQGSHWTDAMESYRRATQSDAGWFEAQYNYGVLAYRLRNYSAALSAYEMALAIQPDSVDARYNFALALKASGYAPDAAAELKKILAANPSEVRAHLALGNLYAQQMHDTAQARAQYMKVLELDPRNPQANDIRFWLSANPA